MTPYWVRMNRGGKVPGFVCVEAESAESAMHIAETHTGCTAVSAQRLPYPSTPRVGPKTNTPAFCHSPNECVGRGSCPREYACND